MYNKWISIQSSVGTKYLQFCCDYNALTSNGQGGMEPSMAALCRSIVLALMTVTSTQPHPAW